MNYRKEIDGLRALAVLPVILFHAGFSTFSGGYIGVDIFFVISGYLITSIILSEIASDKFSLVNFYERRARRILPALSLVLITTVLLGYILMPADLLKTFSQSLVSVTTFSSNIYFYLTNDYFSTASDEMPLLHTWSLAVEEQYYFFFPIILAVLWRFGKKFAFISIMIFATSSLSLAQYLAEQGVVNANFYLIFSRAWELLLGSAIAFFPLVHNKIPKRIKDVLGCIGFSLIILSILVFDEQTPFPSFYTLLPVVGTCLIILFSHSNTFIGQLLSQKVFIFIGLISYSLYLWHQPLFAFLRMKSVGEPDEVLFLLAIIITFVLAYFTWRFVENPFRNKSKYDRKLIFKLSSYSIVFFLVVGLIGHYSNGYEGRFDAKNYSDSIVFSPKRVECHTKGIDYLRPAESCEYFSDNVTWASLGDSHTVEPAYALAERLREGNVGLIQLSFSGCPPSLFFESILPGCADWFKESLIYLEDSSSIKNVLLGFRYSSFLFGDQLSPYPNVPNDDPRLNITTKAYIKSKNELRELYWQSLEESINRILNSGKRIYVLYPIPELPMNINKAIVPFSIFNDKTTLDLQHSTTRDYYFTRNEYILKKLDSLSYTDRLVAIKPYDIFCKENYCPAVVNGQALYFDDDHLSLFGARLLIEKTFSTLKISPSNPGDKNDI